MKWMSAGCSWELLPSNQYSLSIAFYGVQTISENLVLLKILTSLVLQNLNATSTACWSVMRSEFF